MEKKVIGMRLCKCVIVLRTLDQTSKDAGGSDCWKWKITWMYTYIMYYYVYNVPTVHGSAISNTCHSNCSTIAQPPLLPITQLIMLEHYFSQLVVIAAASCTLCVNLYLLPIVVYFCTRQTCKSATVCIYSMYAIRFNSLSPVDANFHPIIACA